MNDKVVPVKIGDGTLITNDWGDLATPGYTESEWHVLGSPETPISVGGWQGEPGSIRLDPYPFDELCILMSGVVALIDTDGNRQEYSAGDAFFVPKAFRGTWETVEPATKYFVAFHQTQLSSLTTAAHGQTNNADGDDNG